MGPPMGRAGSTQPGHLGHSDFFTDDMQSMMSPQFQFGGYPTGTSSFDPSNSMQSPISPLTTNMPVEAQQILGTSTFDPSSPYTSLFMNQSHGLPVPQGVGYSYNPNFSSSKMRQNSHSEGINQTLSPNPMSSAPPKIDTNVDNMSTPMLSSNSLTASTKDSLSSQYAQNLSFGDGGFGMGIDLSRSPSGHGNDFADWIENDESA